MKKMSRLTAGLLCAVLGAALIVPASAHGHGGHHGYQVQYTQPAYDVQYVQPTVIPTCPYGDCAVSGYHFHGGMAYCGTCYDNGYHSGTCTAYNYYGNAYGYYGHHYGCH